jgi:putative flippase GtrA
MIIGTAFRYGCVGLVGTAVHVGIMVLLVEVYGIRPTVSSVAGFIVTVVISYFLNRFWTFAHQATSRWAFPRYVIVSCMGVVLTFGLMSLALDILHWHYLYGQVLVILVIPATNFVLNYLWTFSPSVPEI